MKRPEVRISFDDISERSLFASYAKAKGVSLSALAKIALVQYVAKYPLRRSQLAQAVSLYVNDLQDAKSVQSSAAGANLGGFTAEEIVKYKRSVAQVGRPITPEEFKAAQGVLNEQLRRALPDVDDGR